MSNPSILIVDDDPKISDLLAKYLTQHDFHILTAENAQEMKDIVANNAIDLIILDLMLPGVDGFTICEQLRAENNQVPVLMLTAMNEDEQRLKGFKLGADDYLTKPFNPEELLLRIHAILRRVQHVAQASLPHTKLCFEGWILDKLQRRLFSADNVEVTLTDGEYRLLEALAERAPEVVSRDELLDIVEGREAGPFDRTIDVRVSRLRQKLGDTSRDIQLIKTIRSGGYVLGANVSKER